MWTIFTIIIELVIILLLLFFFFLKFWLFDQTLKVSWDRNSLTRDQTHTSCVGSQSPNHWIASEVPKGYSLERQN